MKCDQCGNPSTIHLTEIDKQTSREMHLCEACAAELRLLASEAQELDLHAIMDLFLDPSEPTPTPPQVLVCPVCGLDPGSLAKIGRLGCPHDYDIFSDQLRPILERVHPQVIHTGKRPRQHAQAGHGGIGSDQRLRLYQSLRAAVAAERYEEAARLRDQLRQKDAVDESR